MRLYTVHARLRASTAPPRPAVAFGAAPAAATVTEWRLVPEPRFWSAVWATIFGPLWLFARGAWLAGLACLLAIVLLRALHPAPGTLLALLPLAIHLGIGLFGQDLRRLELGLGGFRPEGLVAGFDADHALLRLHEARAPGTRTAAIVA